jgi:hypothetical protein
MKPKIVISLSVLIIILTGCASTYRIIDTKNLSYTNNQNCNNKLEVSYIYDIYSITENNKYARKEKNNNFRTIAVRIKNLTDSSRLITHDNFKIYNNESEMLFADKSAYFNSVSQLSGTYLLHALWGPWAIITTSDDSGNSNTKVIYYPVGFAVGLINMFVAISANTKHEKNINDNEIFEKTINPHETISGIVILYSSRYDPLIFKYLDK